MVAFNATELFIWGVFFCILFVAYMTSRPKKRIPTPLKLRQRHGEGKPRAQVKELNIIFSYNGHDFEAFEALGLPAGSSKESAKAAYEDSLKKSDADTHDFLRKAYQSILQK